MRVSYPGVPGVGAIAQAGWNSNARSWTHGFTERVNSVRTRNADQLRASLLADAEFLNHGLVTLDVKLLQVVEQAATLADHHQKTAARSMVLLMRLEMLRQLGDPRAENRDLDLRAAGVVRVRLVLLDDVGFLLSG